MDFWRVVSVLNRRKWLICACVLITAVGTFGATRLVGAQWSATLRFVSSSPVPVSGEPGTGEGGGGAGAVLVAKQQAGIYETVVTSKAVLEPALREAGIPALSRPAQDSIHFEAAGPRLFELQVVDNTPTRAMLLANALGKQFLARNRKLYTQEADHHLEILQEQLNGIDARLAETRRKYDAYRRKHRIVAGVADQLGPALTRLQTVRAQQAEAVQALAAARARRKEREVELHFLPATIRAARAAAASPLVKQLEEELAQVQKQLTVLRVKYTDEKSEVKQALATRDALQAQLDAELKRQPRETEVPNPEIGPVRQALRELKQEIRGLEARLSAIDTTLAAADREVESFSGVDSPLSRWTADINQLTEARTNLVARVEAARLAVDAAQNGDRLAILDFVSDFNPPVNLTAGRTLKLLLIGILGSIIASCGLTILLDLLDRRVRSVHEAERALPAPVIAAIPQALGQVTGASLARATELFPRSLHSETYHFLGMHLLRYTHRDARALMVVSAKVDQGSTVTTTNLGITLAQAGYRVVVVDANLRQPSLHEIFDLPNCSGFSDLLQSGEAADLDEILQPSSVPNLWVVTSGTECENPWERLREGNVAAAGRALRNHADFVLYDTPPMLAFTDALNLVPAVDVAVLSVRALEPTSGAEERIARQLEEAYVSMVGCVLTDVPAADLQSFSNYSRYYPNPLGATDPGLRPMPVGLSEGLGAASESSWLRLPYTETGENGARPAPPKRES